jgi:hypothetical protein
VGQLENEELVRDLSSSFRSIRDTMVHIIGAEELWLSRWVEEQGRTLLNSDDFPTCSSLDDRWDDYRDQINSFILSLKEENLALEISYKNLKGVSYSLELWKQMLHVASTLASITVKPLIPLVFLQISKVYQIHIHEEAAVLKSKCLWKYLCFYTISSFSILPSRKRITRLVHSAILRS